MRIQVRDDKGRPLGAIIIKVEDLDAKQAAKQNKPGWHKLADRLLLRLVRSRQSARVEPTRKTKTAKQSRTVEIRITLPSLPKWPGFKKALSNLKGASKRSLAIGLACLLVIVFALFIVLSGSKNPPATAADSTSKRPQLVRGTPKYTTVLPSGKTITQLGGWARVSPPNRSPVYAYIDHVGKVQLNVSEQPLPAKMKTNTPAQIAQLANNFNAGGKISVGSTTVYIATEENGTQYAIFNIKDLLLLVTSSASLTNNQWAAYVNSLK